MKKWLMVLLCLCGLFCTLTTVGCSKPPAEETKEGADGVDPGGMEGPPEEEKAPESTE